MRYGAVEEEVDDMQEVRGSDPCKDGEITYFSGELWWIIVRSPLSLAVNLHNFTAFTAFHRNIMYKICGEKTNFSPLILHIFAFFSRPGETKLFPFSPQVKKFSAFLAKFQRISLHFSALLCKVFALNFWKNQRISAHFLHNFRKISRPGKESTKTDSWLTMQWK